MKAYKRQWIRFVLAAGVALAATSTTAHAQGAEYFKYTVRKGDSISKITARYLWPVLYGINKDVVGDNPHLIFPKQEFDVPEVGDDFSIGNPRDVETGTVLFATRGEVEFYDKDTEERTKVQTGEEIAGVGTLSVASGTALVRLGDGTVIRLYDNTDVELNGVIVDHRRGTKYRYVTVKQGQMLVEMSEAPGEGDRFEVQTPVAVIEAQGRLFQVDVVTGVATRISAFEGPLRVIGRTRFVDIAEGEGAYLPGQGVKIAKVNLPRAPQMIEPGGVTGEQVEFVWEPVAGADRYVLTVANDRDMTVQKFVGTVYDAASFELQLYNAGDYYWTVDSLSDLGFTSAPRNPKRFTVSTGGGVAGTPAN